MLVLNFLLASTSSWHDYPQNKLRGAAAPPVMNEKLHTVGHFIFTAPSGSEAVEFVTSLMTEDQALI